MIFFSKRTKPLHFAVRLTVVAKLVGDMLLFLAVLTIVPAGVALISGKLVVAVRYAAVIVLMLLAWWGARRIPRPRDLQANEALVVAATMFTLPPLLFTVPLTGYAGVGFLDALFEAVSGVTTTGLSTLGSVADMPWAFKFSRAWTQWIGGLGVLFLAVAMIFGGSDIARRFSFDERETDSIIGGARSHARHTAIVYLTITILGLLLCVGAGLPLAEAVPTALAAVSTGGFAISDASLAAYGRPVKLAVTLVCVLGAISFYIYYRIYHRRWSAVWRDPQWRALLFFGTSTTIILAFLQALDGKDWRQALEAAFYTSFSAHTTAGFSVNDVGSYGAGALLVLIFAMTVGGALGSTAGGIKVMRFLIVLRLIQTMLARASQPRDAYAPIRLGGSTVDDDECLVALTVVFAYGTTLVISWFFFAIGDYPPMLALFEVASATGTAGLSAGIVGPDLEPHLKVILIVDMLLGRVEVPALLVLVFPGSWIGRRRKLS